MIGEKLLSCVEILNSIKPRVNLILEDLIENLIVLTENNYSEALSEFKNLYLTLKNQKIKNIPSFLSNNIIDYSLTINSYMNSHSINIVFVFKYKFPITEIHILNLNI